MNEQLTLDDAINRARRTDPETSWVAANDAKKFAGEHYRIILRFLASISYPAHYLDIENGTVLERHQIARRLPELKSAGFIMECGTKDLGTSRKGTSYRITGKGCEMLNERAA